MVAPFEFDICLFVPNLAVLSAISDTLFSYFQCHWKNLKAKILKFGPFEPEICKRFLFVEIIKLK